MTDDRDRIARVEDARAPGRPALSVVVVAWRDPAPLRACLDSLRRQTERDFEVLIAHNGGAIADEGWRRGLSALRVDLRGNLRQIVARNVGATFARAPLLYFLDDDCVADPSALARVRALFDTTDVVAARSRILFRSASPYNAMARHYDLGDRPLAGHLIESGLAIRTAAWRRFGGYDDALPIGGECMYWLQRVGAHYGLDRVVYAPGPVIRTDYARNLAHFLWKHWRYPQGREEIRARHPEVGRYFDEVVKTQRDEPPGPAATGPLGWALVRTAEAAQWTGRRTWTLRNAWRRRGRLDPTRPARTAP